jgi:hypothetical protein
MGLEDLRAVKTLHIPIHLGIEFCTMFGYDTQMIDIESIEPHWIVLNDEV